MGKSLCMTVVATLLFAGMAEAPALKAAPAHLVMDTTSPGPALHFRKSAFFDTKYLHRAADAAVERYRGTPELTEHATADTKEARAAADATERAKVLAKRYGVSMDLAQNIVDVALAEGIDPELGFRMIRVESGFKPHARGRMGAAGLLQLMPSTARTIDQSIDTRQELLDPTTNLRLGFHYLREMIERYDGDVRLGVLAYNRGEVAVDRALRGGRDPENGYSRKVLGTPTGKPYTGKGLVSRAAKK